MSNKPFDGETSPTTSGATEPVFTSEHIEKAIARFHRRLAELDKFNPDDIRDRQDPSIAALEVAIEEALGEAFGRGTTSYRNYSAAFSLDTAPVSYVHTTALNQIIEGLRRGKARSIKLLQQAISSLEEKSAEMPISQGIDPFENRLPSNNVFIIHGHDDAAKVEVARLIERAGLNAVILHEQPNQGRTIAEKLEHHGGAASFAVAILTPDDWGGRQFRLPNKCGERPEMAQSRHFTTAFRCPLLGVKRTFVPRPRNAEGG